MKVGSGGGVGAGGGFPRYTALSPLNPPFSTFTSVASLRRSQFTMTNDGKIVEGRHWTRSRFHICSPSSLNMEPSRNPLLSHRSGVVANTPPRSVSELWPCALGT